jgi:hypothetical protein
MQDSFDKRIQEIVGAGNPIIRNYILLSISSNTDERLIPIYSDLLNNEAETKQNKFQVIRNLSKYPDEIILKLLSEAYGKNADVDLRREIVSTLQGLKPQLSIDFFIDNLGQGLLPPQALQHLHGFLIV